MNADVNIPFSEQDDHVVKDSQYSPVANVNLRTFCVKNDLAIDSYAKCYVESDFLW